MTFAASQASGWFGLAGVALGGLLTAGLTLYREWRRRRADAAMARRLVSSDLTAVDRALTDAEANLARFKQDRSEPLDDGRQWPFGWERATWAQSWAGYRPGLAASMGDDEFRPLATAVGFIEQLQNSLAAGRRRFQDADEPFLEEVREALEEARAALRPQR